MSFDPVTSDAPLIVYMDIKSPYAFIAKDPTFELADELDIAIDWRPLTLDIPSYLGSAKLDKRGKVVASTRSVDQWGGVRYAYMDARRYAGAWGYALRGTEKIWDTRLIHIAMQWVKRKDPTGRGALRRFFDYVYPRFWVRELDVENMAVVKECITAAKVSTEGFVDWAQAEGGAQHDQQQAEIFAQGIYGVPGYLHQGEYFFGREHLPVLRHRLLDSAQENDHQSTPQKRGLFPGIGNVLPSIACVEASLDTPGTGKQQVFLAMQRAARNGELQITAGINSHCPQSQMMIPELDALLEQHALRLHVDWGALPATTTELAEAMRREIDVSGMSRGDAHRAIRSRYRHNDVIRYLGWHEVIDGAAEQRELVAALDEKEQTPQATDLLMENGVRESFGYVFVDEQGNVHPFNGRQHLSVLRWALESEV